MKLLREPENSGHVDANEAAAWRCRILGWPKFFAVDVNAALRRRSLPSSRI